MSYSVAKIFSYRPSNDFVSFLLTLVVIALFIGLLMPAHGPQTAGKMMMARNDLKTISAAIGAYYVQYGDYPAGDNRQIFAALHGGNSRQILFIDCSPRQINAKGEFIDPWGTPYMIGILSPHHILLRSAGPNRVFNDPKSINEDFFP